MLDHAVMSPAEYYRLPQVVARVREFCGLSGNERSHCAYLAAMGAADGPHPIWGHAAPRPPDELDALLATGADLVRSMWDTGSLLVYVDLDYLHTDEMGEAFVHPGDTFLKLEPVYRCFESLFDEFRLPMLDLVTGAGYSFVGRVPLDGDVAARLAALATEPPAWLTTHAVRRPPWLDARIGEDTAKAFHGLGMLLEHLAHRAIDRVGLDGAIPLVVNNTEVGTGPNGRECVSIDLTHLGDPLDSRLLRVPFGLYQKHRLRPDLVGGGAARVAPIAVLPRRRREFAACFGPGRGLARAAREAVEADTTIPDVSAGLERLLADYKASDLSAWHRRYAQVRLRSLDVWSDPGAGFGMGDVPPCVSACVEHPNDLLLKPTHIQLLVRSLLARGWHARDVAGLVLARYGLPDAWGDHWERVDPATRADFDVRVFAGLVAMGRDRGVDFNCVSTQEKRMCPGTGCPHDLRRERDRMLARARA